MPREAGILAFSTLALFLPIDSSFTAGAVSDPDTIATRSWPELHWLSFSASSPPMLFMVRLWWLLQLLGLRRPAVAVASPLCGRHSGLPGCLSLHPPRPWRFLRGRDGFLFGNPPGVAEKIPKEISHSDHQISGSSRPVESPRCDLARRLPPFCAPAPALRPPSPPEPEPCLSPVRASNLDKVGAGRVSPAGKTGYKFQRCDYIPNPVDGR
jgi:hypothetical protein